MRVARVHRCGRQHVLGLCLLNVATFPMPKSAFPGAILARDWWALQRRLHINDVLVATKRPFGKVVGSVEVHSAEYLRQQSGNLNAEQALLLQPYLCSLAVAPQHRGCGLGRQLVQAAVDDVRRRHPNSNACVLLQVEANNTAASRLYSHCGFECISHPGCEVALMRRFLHDPKDTAVMSQGQARSIP